MARTTLAATTTLFSLPLAPSWLENLAFRPSTGTILATRLGLAQVWSISTSNGTGNLLANLPDTKAFVGITQTRSSPDEFYVAGLDFNTDVEPGSCALWKLAFPADGGKSTFEAAFGLPNMTLINGLAAWDETSILAADSRQENIWKIDLTTGDAAVVLQDPTMAAVTTGRNGVNGVKVHRSCEGVHVYYTSTDAGIFARVPVDPLTADAVGPVEVLARGVGAVDDFALRPDGFAFIATGVNNTIVRVGLDGSMETVAEVSSGTACQFGNKGELYVTTGGSAAAGSIFAVNFKV